MPTEKELLSAIDASPDDAAPRLAHADWLQANGDPARAEFIRLQVEAVPDWDERVSGLLDANRKRWLEGRPVSDGMVWEFERGYPEAVEFRTLKAFRAGWNAAAHGARHLVFACLNGNASSLAAEPGLRLARSLRLRFCYRGRGLLDLLRSPHLAQLERLSLTGDGLTDEFVEGLAGLSSLPSLVALELSPWGPLGPACGVCPVGAGGAGVLAQDGPARRTAAGLMQARGIGFRAVAGRGAALAEVVGPDPCSAGARPPGRARRRAGAPPA
jgi:uncharacterized protein (TIGR02996 family)